MKKVEEAGAAKMNVMEEHPSKPEVREVPETQMSTVRTAAVMSLDLKKKKKEEDEAEEGDDDEEDQEAEEKVCNGSIQEA
ncbi:hypothetical protein STEG23_031449 [Scotinomys teguina]